MNKSSLLLSFKKELLLFLSLLQRLRVPLRDVGAARLTLRTGAPMLQTTSFA
jgi:hypothetical protein